MTAKPPGWYDDGNGALRWWDGSAWSEHAAPLAPASDDDGDMAVATVATGPTVVLSPVPDELAPVPPDDPLPTPDGAASGSGSGARSGGDHPRGAFMAATGSDRQSRGWVVWVVLGVVLLGIVIAASVLIPMLLLGGSQTQPTPSPTASPTSTQTPVASPTPTPTAPADQQQVAINTVRTYDEAWQEVDCDKYFASTTVAFREWLQVPDCETFTTDANAFLESVTDYDMTVAGAEQYNGGFKVFTVETYTSTDTDHDPDGEPHQHANDWVYVLVLDEGHWAIDEADSTEIPDAQAPGPDTQ